ncbi:MAG TPA: hypothetical protein VMW42_01740 [Desulfatiglandales bacterium]|nr:hypothetical protein [Desulfatiglandales bacterium]
MKIFRTLKKRVGFSEVTGGRALSFRDLSMGETTGLGSKIYISRGAEEKSILFKKI